MSNLDPKQRKDERVHPVQPLDYDGSAPSSRTPGAIQIILGAVGWFIVVGETIAVGQVSFNAAIIGFFFGLSILIVVSFVQRRRDRWTLFVPGVLIGFGLSILIGAGLCFQAFKNI